MRVLLIGEDAVPGSGAYLLGILNALRATAVHVPSKVALDPRLVTQRFDALIFSDYPRVKLSEKAERAIIHHVRAGYVRFRDGLYGKGRGSKHCCPLCAGIKTIE